MPKAPGDFLVLRAIRESVSATMAVSNKEMLSATGERAESEGIFACPQVVAAVAGLAKLLETGFVSPDEMQFSST